MTAPASVVDTETCLWRRAAGSVTAARSLSPAAAAPTVDASTAAAGAAAPRRSGASRPPPASRASPRRRGGGGAAAAVAVVGATAAAVAVAAAAATAAVRSVGGGTRGTRRSRRGRVRRPWCVSVGGPPPALGLLFFLFSFFFLLVRCAVANRRHCAAMRRPWVRRWARQGGPSHRWSRACVRATAGRPSAGVDPTQGQRGTLVAPPARCRRRCGSAASDTAALRRQQRRAGRRCCRCSAAVSGAASAARRRSGGAVTTTRCRATRRPRAATGPHRAASSWHSERHASCGRSPGHGTRPTIMIRPYDTHTDARCARQRGHGSQTALSRRRRPRSDWCGAGGADEKKTRAHFEQKRNEKDTERGRPRAVGLPTSNLCSTKQASMYINHAHSPTRHILLLN